MHRSHQEFLEVINQDLGVTGSTSETWPIPIRWVDDRSLPVRFISHSRRMGQPWRRSAEMAFGTSDVYLESFGGRGWAPGFAFTDVRIALDGAVVGRAWTLGCSLGGGGARGPAVAMLRDDLALRLSADMRNLELVTLREPGESE